MLVVQRYPPDWRPTEGSSAVGPIGVRVHDIDDRGAWFAASVTYTLGQRTWTQRFEAAIVDDGELASLAATTGLVVQQHLDDPGAWVVLAPLTTTTG